jgi:hypothetical protein
MGPSEIGVCGVLSLGYLQRRAAGTASVVAEMGRADAQRGSEAGLNQVSLACFVSACVYDA